MSRFTQICFFAGTACLALAFILHEPLKDSNFPKESEYAKTAAPPPSRRVSLAAVTPRPTRTVSIPAAYRSRVIARPVYPRPSSPRPRRPVLQRARNSEELLERALAELAREVEQLKRNREAEERSPILPITAIPEELAPEPAAGDPLAHLPAVRRRPDIRAEGTAFTPFGFRVFKSDWADVVFRQFRTPGLI